MSYANYAVTDRLDQDDFIGANLELVKRIAQHLVVRLPNGVDLDDLMQAGMIGLLEASRRFDASKGASFETFAGIRIRGSMLDEVRRRDWTPRSVHQKQRNVSNAVRELENETGRAATGQEIAARLGVSLGEYHDILTDSAGCRLFSLEESTDDPVRGRDIPCANTASPDQLLNSEQFKHQLANSISALPEREQLVLSLYYERELNQKEIGAVLSVSESRVCQILGQALVRLRAMTDLNPD